MEIYFVRLDPVQEVAAEPATLDLLMDILRPKATVEHRATPELLTAARATGWPLVYDDTIPPGYVHCRPSSPRAFPPPVLQEMRECLERMMALPGGRAADAASVAAEESRSPIEIGLDGIRHALTDVQFTSMDQGPPFVWQHGESTLPPFTLTATFQPSNGVRGLCAWVDEHIRVRRASTVDRLAADLGISSYVARRHFDAVQDVLEQAGVGDGYGRLTLRQPVRPPVQAPAR